MSKDLTLKQFIQEQCQNIGLNVMFCVSSFDKTTPTHLVNACISNWFSGFNTNFKIIIDPNHGDI